MYVACNINTFFGKFNIYGTFLDEASALLWVENEGSKIDPNLSLWSVIEIKVVN